jgi:hypothetical protein
MHMRIHIHCPNSPIASSRHYWIGFQAPLWWCRRTNMYLEWIFSIFLLDLIGQTHYSGLLSGGPLLTLTAYPVCVRLIRQTNMKDWSMCQADQYIHWLSVICVHLVRSDRDGILIGPSGGPIPTLTEYLACVCPTRQAWNMAIRRTNAYIKPISSMCPPDLVRLIQNIGLAIK